jgi:hypothetical protein
MLTSSIVPYPQIARTQALRLILLGLSVALLLFGAAVLVANAGIVRALAGQDFAGYLRHARDWLGGGSFYAPRQLAGPYAIADGDSLYPPPMVLLFIPFLVLPAVLWWLLPGAVVVLAMRRFRPAPWTWPLMAACFVFPCSLALMVAGNPCMWCAAAVAAALLWHWPGVLVLLKPTLAPFAVIGAHRRSWWLALAGLGVLSLLFAPGWSQYLAVIRNQTSSGWWYSVGNVPLVSLPIVAWLGRTRRESVQGNSTSSHRSGFVRFSRVSR